MMDVLTLPIQKPSTHLTLPSRALSRPTLHRLDEFGLKVTGRLMEPDWAVFVGRSVCIETDDWFCRCR